MYDLHQLFTIGIASTTCCVTAVMCSKTPEIKWRLYWAIGFGAEFAILANVLTSAT